MTETAESTGLRKELDEKFAQLDNESKLMVAFMGLSQVPAGYRRFLDMGQLKHAYTTIYDDSALATAESISPEVAANIRELRRLIAEGMDPAADYYDDEFGPVGREAYSTYEFLWGDTFTEPIWFECRHIARDSLRTLEAILDPKGPPPGEGPPA